MQQFVIFGGGGFIGNHLRRHLLERHPDARVHVADLVAAERGPTAHVCDVRGPIRLPLDPDAETVVFNLAAVHTTPGHADREYFETNIAGAENVCDFARRMNVRALLFTSSIAPYGASEDCKSEETLPMPTTPYGISKLVAEKIHMIWQAEDPGRRLSIVRPGIVFGTGEGGNFTRLYAALTTGLFAYPGRRDTLKAGIYVKDLVRVMVDMVHSPRAQVQLYNACFREPPRLDAIVESMQHVIGRKRWIPTLPPTLMKVAARTLALPGLGRLGMHPDRVSKLMVSTNVDGSKLDRDYPLRFTLQEAIEDWWVECGRRELR